MKKIYLKPETESAIMKNSMNLCSGTKGTGDTSNDPTPGSDTPTIVPAPKKRTPAF